MKDWVPSTDDINAGIGGLGTCCPEMDIWEANDISTAYTPHPCDGLTQVSCQGDACGGTYSADRYAGTCDPDGCDFNAYRQGNKTFYGPGSGFNVDTTKKVTVVTQFLTGTNGKLSEIKRLYVQNGKVIANAASTISGVSGSSITADYCTKQKSVFGDEDSWGDHGGLSRMSDALAAPMVLVMSLWHDVSIYTSQIFFAFPIIPELTPTSTALLAHALARLDLPCRLFQAWRRPRLLCDHFRRPL